MSRDFWYDWSEKEYEEIRRKDGKDDPGEWDDDYDDYDNLNENYEGHKCG